MADRVWQLQLHDWASSGRITWGEIEAISQAIEADIEDRLAWDRLYHAVEWGGRAQLVTNERVWAMWLSLGGADTAADRRRIERQVRERAA